MYNMDVITLAKTIISDIKKRTGITATCGIGTNMYLAKIALDILAKHNKDYIGYLDEKLYKELLWDHTPLTDFWQIGRGIQNRLYKHHIKTMREIANCNPKILYKEFGIEAEYLIDHANGIEPMTIREIKAYKPKSTSISNSQILFRNYNEKEARIIITEMIDNLVLELVKRNLYVNNVSIYISLSNSDHITFSVNVNSSNSYNTILNKVLNEYDYLVESNIIRKIGISFNDLNNKKYEQLDLFNNIDNSNDLSLEKTMYNIKSKYGKNSILRCISLDENATMMIRNNYIGGHNAK